MVREAIPGSSSTILTVPSWPEDNLDTVVLFVPENFIAIWCLLQAQVMRDHKGGINLALLVLKMLLRTAARLFRERGRGPFRELLQAVSRDAALLLWLDSNSNGKLALEQWVEKGTAPADIIAGKYDEGSKAPKMTRPLCPYPQVAKYKGSGDAHDAANFTCAAP